MLYTIRMIKKGLSQFSDEEYRIVLNMLESHRFLDDFGQLIIWTPGQIDIIACIFFRRAPDGRTRVQIMTTTQYGKSKAVGVGVALRAAYKPGRWALVAPSNEKAKIIMDNVIKATVQDPLLRSQLVYEGSQIDRLMMERSKERLVYKDGGEVRVFSVDSRNKQASGEALMGFGSPNVIEDESALIEDEMHAKVMRMLGGFPDNNFLLKIGNPFRRNHFLKSHQSDRYYKILVDYHQAVEEGRLTADYVQEQRETISPAMFQIFYECEFPAADSMDDKGWMPLLTEEQIEKAFVDKGIGFGDPVLGSDVAGEGRNLSVNVVRWPNYMKIVRKENEPDVVKWGTKIVMDKNTYRVHPHNVAIDKNGVGLGSYNQVNHLVRSAFTGSPGVIGIVSGTAANDQELYRDLKAEMFMELRKWVIAGGMIERDKAWFELTKIHYRVIEEKAKRKIEIMGKLEMKSNGWESPDTADAGSFTFFRRQLEPGSRVNAGAGSTATEESIPVLDPY